MEYSDSTKQEEILAELQRDWQRYDSDIASIVGVPIKEVAKSRRKNYIPHYSPYVKRRMAIEADLRANPEVTDQQMAVKHRCCGVTVAKYRAELGLPKAKRAVKTMSEATLKARAMLEADPTLTDLYISRECGISFAHVARQRDLMGLPRSPRGNRMTRRKRDSHDYTKIDADILSNDFTYKVISLRNSVPYEWVTNRARVLGVTKKRAVTPEVYQKVLDLLQQEDRMTDRQIANTLGIVSAYIVSEIRRKAGIPRLQPGLPKREASRQAMALLSEPDRKSLSQIARETGLTVTTVTKIRNRMMNNLKGTAE
jgi:DNA-binding Lrp family transcriptional regulator